MKKMIRASIDTQQRRDIDGYLRAAVRNIADYAYDNATLSEDDPRADYFVTNICNDLDVIGAKDALREAIEKAIDNQMRR